MLKKLALLLLVLSIGYLLLILFYDEPPSEGVQDWLAKRAEADASAGDSYYYFLGSNAPADQDPVAFGKAIYQQELARIERALTTPSQATAAMTVQPDEINLFDEFYNCGDSYPDCLREWLNGTAKRSMFLSKTRLGRERYKTLSEFDDYATRSLLSMVSPNPPYQNLTMGQRATHIAILHTAASGNLVWATQLAQQSLRYARQKLQWSDTLIQKMVARAMLVDEIDFLLAMHQMKLIALPDDFKIPPLTLEEQDFTDTLIHEFAFTHHQLMWMEKVNESDLDYPDDYTLRDRLEWLTYKPNLLANDRQLVFEDILIGSKLEGADFRLAVENYRHGESSSTLYQNFMNPFSREILGHETLGFLVQYVASVKDIQLKIDLFNIAFAHSAESISTTLQAPESEWPMDYSTYYGGDWRPYLKNSQQQLCFKALSSREREGQYCVWLASGDQ